MAEVETAEEESRVRARTERLAVSQTEIALTLRASAALAAPAATEDVDASALPRITLDRRGGLAPPSDGRRPDLAILRTIGEGGMGRVHLARQRSLGREVAVKTLKADASPAVSFALLREARITGMLEHPGVIPVHALGVDDAGGPMLVMKRVDGVDLATRLAGEPQTGDALVLVLEALMQVCRTLEFAHDRGIIHRDIKPENIMLGGFGEVYLLDWGIATPSTSADARDEPLVGTPVYMAPEMVVGRPVDARTDVYLVGATLHEVLTGLPRHAGRTITEVTRAAFVSAPQEYGPDVPAALAELCNRATSRDPERRPSSAAVMREEIASFLRHRTARVIAEAALGRLAALDAALAEEPGPPRDLAGAYRLVAEARFGLTQSLSQVPGDGAARAGMRRCIAAAIELELRQGHVESAEALLRDLDVEDADLARRIADRRALEVERAKEHARLASLDRDLDPTEHAGRRTLPIVAVAVLLAGGGLLATVGLGTVTPATLAVVAGFATVVMAIAIVAVRKRILTNAFNRRTAALTLVGIGAAASNRFVGLATDRPPVQTLAVDLFVFAVVALCAAITLLKDLWVCVVILALGVVATLVWPDHAPYAFTASTFLNFTVGAAILARARR